MQRSRHCSPFRHGMQVKVHVLRPVISSHAQPIEDDANYELINKQTMHKIGGRNTAGAMIFSTLQRGLIGYEAALKRVPVINQYVTLGGINGRTAQWAIPQHLPTKMSRALCMADIWIAKQPLQAATPVAVYGVAGANGARTAGGAMLSKFDDIVLIAKSVAEYQAMRRIIAVAWDPLFYWCFRCDARLACAADDTQPQRVACPRCDCISYCSNGCRAADAALHAGECHDNGTRHSVLHRTWVGCQPLLSADQMLRGLKLRDEVMAMLTEKLNG